MPDTQTIIELLETGGLVAALAIALLAMLRGWVWPEKMVDRALEEQRKAGEVVAEQIAIKMSNGMKDAVRSGILEARAVSTKTEKA